MPGNHIKEYWERFLSIPGNHELYSHKKYSFWHFDHTEESANNLLFLVKAGKKKGTTSLIESYVYDEEQIPKNGDLSIILVWKGYPGCIIETIKVESTFFKDVTEEFARIEGEGDMSLEYWREVHERYFKSEAERIGVNFTENSIIICEQFKVIYDSP